MRESARKGSQDEETLLIRTLKLLMLNLPKQVVCWIIDFLMFRKQRTKLSNECYSEWLYVLAGVLQGTKLGPWMFLLMVNELHALGLDVWKFASIHVQYTRTESDRLGYATVRLTGCPIARDLEKYIEVFIEGVKCWRIDSVGHGRTRSVSLCVGSTERKSDREKLSKIH